jgi:hypothetical protein
MQVRLPSPGSARSFLAALSLCAAALALPAHAAAPAAPPGPLADFGATQPPAAVKEVANWSFFTHDNEGRAVVILDKHNATVYAFDPKGHLIDSAPALLGLTVGDDTPEGVGDKPLSDIPEDQRTTPAGRFVARPGHDDTGVDVVWVDYDAAVAMHRVITTFPAQHRPERLRSPRPEDRRISWGCINLPIPFYEQVLSPTVRKIGAVVYILPETKSLREVFGSWDVTDPAAHPPAKAKHAPEAQSRAEPPPHRLREAQAVRTSDAPSGL